MLLVAKVLILVGLIGLLVRTEKPLLCAAIYTGCGLVLGLAINGPSLLLLALTPLSFGLALLYFWLLDRFQDSPLLFFTILALGLVLGVV